MKNQPLELIPPSLYASCITVHSEPIIPRKIAVTIAQNTYRRLRLLIPSISFSPLATMPIKKTRISVAKMYVIENVATALAPSSLEPRPKIMKSGATIGEMIAGIPDSATMRDSPVKMTMATVAKVSPAHQGAPRKVNQTTMTAMPIRKASTAAR